MNERPAPAPVRCAPRGRTEARLAADREGLRALGIPVGWTRRFAEGDRFTALLAMLGDLPELQIAGGTPAVAVIGPAGVVELEAHRAALDLPVGSAPRPVVTVPARAGTERRAAVAQARHTRPLVVAVEADGYADPVTVRRVVRSVQADVVIAVVDAARPLAETAGWLEALENVHAVSVDGAGGASAPAEVLALGLPVVRVDGAPIDRTGWAALLCAQLTSRGAAGREAASHEAAGH